jgi:hypothetical protein
MTVKEMRSALAKADKPFPPQGSLQYDLFVFETGSGYKNFTMVLIGHRTDLLEALRTAAPAGWEDRKPLLQGSEHHMIT